MILIIESISYLLATKNTAYPVCAKNIVPQKISSLGRSCDLCFETVLGTNKITPSHPPKIKKDFFILMIF